MPTATPTPAVTPAPSEWMTLALDESTTQAAITVLESGERLFPEWSSKMIWMSPPGWTGRARVTTSGPYEANWLYFQTRTTPIWADGYGTPAELVTSPTMEIRIQTHAAKGGRLARVEVEVR
jgi:hypothetical protein